MAQWRMTPEKASWLWHQARRGHWRFEEVAGLLVVLQKL
jgi:hypothetical protein